jgi:hypothetical protein
VLFYLFWYINPLLTLGIALVSIRNSAICQGNNFDTATGLGNHVPDLHVGDCKGFNGPQFLIPKVGDRLKVTGVYAQDIFEGGHTEIHPVYKIEVIGASSSSSSDLITTTPSSY